MKVPTSYIITNLHNTTLYIGVTSNLCQRIYQHKNKLASGFSAKYNLTKLIYYERFVDMDTVKVAYTLRLNDVGCGLRRNDGSFFKRMYFSNV